MTPKPGRSTDGFYVIKGEPHQGAICWFCDGSIRSGGVMVKYLYTPSAPPRPVCPDCAKELEPE